jgi:large subunit ribosomal protein L3
MYTLDAVCAVVLACHSCSRPMQVLMIDMEESALIVKGSVPGKPGGLVEITPHKTVGVNC